MLYSRERGLVRLGGRDYPLTSDGRALRLLVEESGGAPARGAVHTADPPPWSDVPASRVRLIAGALRAMLGGRPATNPWLECLTNDPLIRSFLARSGAGGPA